MIFTSLLFIAFLAVVFVLYYLVPAKYQWVILLLGNIVFYLCSDVRYFTFLFSSIGVTYFVARKISSVNKEQDALLQEKKETLTKEEKKKIKGKYGKRKQVLCAVAILINIGILFILKYLGFFVEIGINILQIPTDFTFSFFLPLGISFYTFSSIGYVIDVYRGSYEAEKNLFKYALFVSFFPTILQGPISSYQDLSQQLVTPKKFAKEKVTWGVRRVILGFFKKIVIADMLSLVVNPLFSEYGKYYGWMTILASILYAIQIYADFSGYMDIALGVGQMLGIKIEENFDLPYLSSSISEFWRRWHITLGKWFKNYVYYPIIRSDFVTKTNKVFRLVSKNFAEKASVVIALTIVWILIGLWHGSNVNYLIYGIFHGGIIVFEVVLAPVYKKTRHLFKISDASKIFKAFQITRTFAIVCVGYLLFRSPGIRQAFSMMKRCLYIWRFDGIFDGTIFQLGLPVWGFILVALSIIICYVFASLFRQTNSPYLLKIDLSKKTPKYLQICFFALIIWVTIGTLIYQYSLGDFSSEFIYFNF